MNKKYKCKTYVNWRMLKRRHEMYFGCFCWIPLSFSFHIFLNIYSDLFKSLVEVPPSSFLCASGTYFFEYKRCWRVTVFFQSKKCLYDVLLVCNHKASKMNINKEIMWSMKKRRKRRIFTKDGKHIFLEYFLKWKTTF